MTTEERVDLLKCMQIVASTNENISNYWQSCVGNMVKASEPKLYYVAVHGLVFKEVVSQWCNLVHDFI